jgi:hypothetical protein
MIKYLLIPIVALLTSCAVLQNPALNQVVIAGAVSAALQRVPEVQRAKVANNINTASELYNALAGPDGVPSVEQFAAALDVYLPDDPSKPLASAALISLYSAYYQQIADHSPKDQLALLGAFLAGAKAGALPYMK